MFILLVGAQKPVVEAVIEQRPVTPPVDSAHSSPAHTATQEAVIDEQLKTALVDELKKGRPELRPVSPTHPSHSTSFQTAEMIY